MEQFKRIQVIMLFAEESMLSLVDKNKIGISKKPYLFYSGIEDRFQLSKSYKPQHLYFLSDDKIEEGDWYLLREFGYPDQIRQGSGFTKKQQESINAKKIIATTDTSLRIRIEHKSAITDKEYPYRQSLPQPSQQFIEKYVEMYNAGTSIIDVLVEYEKYGLNMFYDEDCTELNCGCHSFRLKVNPKDNTITIKKFKDSWSREEVEMLLERAIMDANKSATMLKHLNYKSWIKENL